MENNINQFESFEKQFLELVSESVTSSESCLRDAIRAEASRAESAELSRDGALRAEVEARANAAAATATAQHAAATLAKVQDELAATKMEFELAERHRVTLEEKCTEMSEQIESLNKELQRLRPLQDIQANLQQQYTELQERVQKATSDAGREASRLEAELRRVEKCAGAGAELRERARLAAAAHVQERKLAAAELQHTTRDLQAAKAEVVRLTALVAELQCQVSSTDKSSKTNITRINSEALSEIKAMLELESAGTARLEKALAAALSDNAALAALLHSVDNAASVQSSPKLVDTTNICPIDDFLAD